VERVADTTRRVAAIDRVDVAANVGVERMGTEGAGVAEHAGVVAARLLGRESLCAGALVDVLVGQQHLLPRAKRQRVLPRRLLAPGDEATLDVAAARQVVDRARGLQRRGPGARRLAAVVERGDSRDQAIAKV